VKLSVEQKKRKRQEYNVQYGKTRRLHAKVVNDTAPPAALIPFLEMAAGIKKGDTFPSQKQAHYRILAWAEYDGRAIRIQRNFQITRKKYICSVEKCTFTCIVSFTTKGSTFKITKLTPHSCDEGSRVGLRGNQRQNNYRADWLVPIVLSAVKRRRTIAPSALSELLKPYVKIPLESHQISRKFS
jgi:hypothetical protein